MDTDSLPVRCEPARAPVKREFRVLGVAGVYVVEEALKPDEIETALREIDGAVVENGVARIQPSAAISARVHKLLLALNDKAFNYEAGGHIEFAYMVAQGPQPAAMDWGIEHARRSRKLSFMIPLEPFESFALFANSPTPIYIPAAAGNLSVFASTMVAKLMATERPVRFIVGRLYGLEPLQ